MPFSIGMRESSAGAFGPVIFWLCTVLAFTVVGVCAQTSGFKCKMLSGYTYDLQKLGSTVKTTHLSYDYTYTPGAPVSCGGAGMTALCEQYSTLMCVSLIIVLLVMLPTFEPLLFFLWWS